ncbi:integrator complex subunit 12-like [Amphibalanus amphitrite]|uniref:integrator complex subunit 12-like n=1 Tax=Amphibalanus amphitrite TaxID=1232801 RepID=UPI001C928F59|nr:integrator complex subunit 12-like [Amphibalanus amphitrite]
MELDPLFVRGLRLLHSRSRDSVDQLRALLEEVRQRTGRAGGKLSPVNRSPRSTPGPTGRPDTLPIKRGLDKIKEDIGEFGSKRARVESPVAFKSHTPSPTMSRDSDGSKKSEDSDLNDTAGLEMDFMDQLACVVCRNIGVSTGNQLIECAECGNLYHQECHRPAITEQERGDTRSVWLCSSCRDQQQPATGSSRSLLKPTVTASAKPDKKSESLLAKKDSKGSSLASGSRPAPGVSLLKTKVSSKPLGSLHMSKSSMSSGKGHKSSGSGRSVPGSPSSAKAGGGAAPPPNSMVSAERRMQLMKKKAAAKLNEKRKN